MKKRLKVVTISEEEWKGPKLRSVETVCKSEQDALAALDRLDGKKKTSIEFSTRDGKLMNIGGGGDSFVVFVALCKDDETLTLVDPSKPAKGFVDIVAGGQAGSYPKRHSIGKEMVAAALLYFCEHGNVSPELTWES